MTSDECEKIVDDFASAVQPRPPVEGWYILTGKAGPNATLKLIIPPVNGKGGYILTIARCADTAVIDHEVGVLHRLKAALPGEWRDTIPDVLVHRSWSGRPYFAMPIYESASGRRIYRRLTRARRFRWMVKWLTEIGRCTVAPGLTCESIEAEYASTILRMQTDPAIAKEWRVRVQKSYEIVIRRADQLPTVCCHGDIWSGNILWTSRARHAVVIDWGAARWPGLPGVDLCRYVLSNLLSEAEVRSAMETYCRALDLDLTLVAPLYDLHNVFIKAELDLAYAHQPDARFDPFAGRGGCELQRRCSLLTSAIEG